MTAKEYLKRIKKIDNLINAKIEEIDNLKEFAKNISAVNSESEKVQSGQGDKIGNAVAKIVDLEREITDEVDYLVDLKRKIKSEIDKIENADYVNILYKRYFEYKTWERIAVDMNYTMRWVQKLHGNALKEFIEVHTIDRL